ncbi:transposase [Streptomyces sp. NPDC050287]|uniref:transposase n=1 Tax=Streptomyces sp. NPDC050287 TaxID=3365608 RepID=UPI0037BBA6AB
MTDAEWAEVRSAMPVPAWLSVGEDSRGYDGGKSRDGRKRHILTDTEGLLLEVTVTTADVHDSKAAGPTLLETFMDQPGRLLKLVWVDSAYQGPALVKAFARHGVRIEVVERRSPLAPSRCLG